ncbi:MAG TPA: trypsin-like peptidase domain-containing protein [Sandaracinaceae bacterium LLY-WYZ-13_1]|nr:trypsin-like peptidase domain-containing protein [Sandaracinaceae bacterium LLY-WYZ-13_1]
MHDAARRRVPRAMGALAVLTALTATASAGHAQELTDERRIAVARRLSESTVSVVAGPSTGSGFVTGDERWIVTNSHVIRPGRRHGIRVRFSSGTTRAAGVLLDSPSHDLAVLQVRGEVPARPLALADSDRVSVGQTVLAFGSPFGLDGTLTQGIVSALRDVPPGSRLGGGEVPRLIQTDAPINPGNSGGPLVSSAGEVIGVNTAILSRTGGSHGIGFAIPSNHVTALLEDLRRRAVARRSGDEGSERRAEAESRERDEGDAPVTRNGHPGGAFLGIYGAEFDGGGVAGVRIQRVVPDGPADRAGLAGSEDSPPSAVRRLGIPWTGHIIVAVDGHPTRSMRELEHALSRHRPGHRAVLDLSIGPNVLRGRAVVTLGRAPAGDED